MKTRLQRQRSATSDHSESDRTNSSNGLAVQAQPAAESATAPLDMQMQRASEMGHSLGGFTIQPALAIGEPGDKYEQEADEIAGQAVQMQADAGAAADPPAANDGPSDNAGLQVQNRLNSNNDVQRQPNLDVGGDLGGMTDLGGGDMGGMADVAGGGDLGGASGDLGGMADAMGSGDMTDVMGGGDLGGMADAMGGGDMGDMAGGGIEEMAEAVGGSEMSKVVGDMEDGGDMEDMTEGEGEEVETGEVNEMLGASDVDLGFGEDGIEGKIRKAIATGGEPLPDEIQDMLRSRIGMENPEDIRVHTGGQANELCDELGALAFTTGNHIFFAAGEYDPDSSEGQELIFHEAVHTVQQGAIEGGGEAEETEVDVGMKADPTQVASNTMPVQAEETETTDDKTDDQEDEQTGASNDSEAMAAEGQKDAQDSVDGDEGDSPSTGDEEVHTDAPPADAVGTAQDVFTPVPGVEPETVPTPDALGNPLEPMQEMEWEDGMDAAKTEAGSAMDDLDSGGDSFPDLNAALAQALLFTGDDAGDVLNLQMRSEVNETIAAPEPEVVTTTEDSKDDWDAGEAVRWPEEMSKSDTGSPAGDWIVDNMFLAGTSGKVVDIANLMAGDKSWFALTPKHWAHMFGYMAITFEIFVNILELITGILDIISLALLSVMLLCMILQAIFLAICFLPFGWGLWAITPATFFNTCWTTIAAWLVTMSNIIAFFTLIRLFLRGLVIILWLLDALLAGAVLGWEHAKVGLGRAAVQAVGAVGDIVSLVAFKMTGGGFGKGAAASATSTGGSTFGKGALSVASRDASETIGEALLEEVVIGLTAEFAGAGIEYAQKETDTAVQAQADESQIEAVRESNEIFDEKYEEYQASHEESKDALPELPEDDPLAMVQNASSRVAACDAEDEQTQAAIAETEMLIRGKQLWAEDLYGGEVLMAEYHAQQEQSQIMSESYQERTAMAGSEIADAKPMMEEAQSQTGDGSDQLKGQQGNIKQGGSMGSAAGGDVPVAEGPVAQQGADLGAQDAAQGPGTSDEGEAAAGKAMGEQGAQVEESASIQSDIEGRQNELEETQAINQEEIERLMEQREELYAYWESVQEARENASSDRDDGLGEGEDWSSEVFAIIQGFMEESVADSEGGEDEETDEEDVDQEDVPESDELEDEEELPTLDEALANFVEAWQAMAEELGASEDEGQEELAETVVG